MENEYQPTVEDVQAAFGYVPDEEETSENTESNSQPEEKTSENQVNQEAPQTEASKPKLGFGNQDAKQNQAFAKMRTENANMQKTMAMLAQTLGVNPKLPADQLSAQLQAQARGVLAKQQNIDPAILERLDHLESINAEYTRAKLEQQTATSLRTIEEKYGATRDDLNVFVNELLKENYDISQTGANLEYEFIKRNFDQIVKNKVKEAVSAEQERSIKASGASQPNKKQGQENRSESKEVNTMADFESFLNEVANT